MVVHLGEETVRLQPRGQDYADWLGVTAPRGLVGSHQQQRPAPRPRRLHRAGYDLEADCDSVWLYDSARRAWCRGLSFLLHALEELSHEHARRGSKYSLTYARDHSPNLRFATDVDSGSVLRVAQRHQSLTFDEARSAGAIHQKAIAGCFNFIGNLHVAGKGTANRRNTDLHLGEIAAILLKNQRLATRNAVLKNR